MGTNYYKRDVDAGHGRQYVEVTDGTITRQWLEATQGYYTGDGNPELIGQPQSAMRGYGFRRVSQTENYRLLENLYDTEWEEA